MISKRIFSLFITIILLLLAVSGCQKFQETIMTIGGSVSTPQYAATPVRVYETPLPEFEPMQFVWFYKPPENQNDLGAVAANFSMAILTRNDEPQRETLRDMGADFPVLQYLRAEAIMGTNDCSKKPFQNQVANLEGDYCILKEQNEDWFMKDLNGNLIQYDQSDYVFMDPGNPGWQAYYLDRVKGFQKDSGWQGLFLDNIDGGLGRFENMNLLLGRYADDQSYQAANQSFLRNLYENAFAHTSNVLYANIPYLSDQSTWFNYLQYLDGAMLEAFAADWDNGYLHPDEWLAQLDLAEQTQAQGKSIFLITQGTIDDTQRMRFGLASFLLVNNGQAYFRYTNDKAYRDLWWYADFDIDLGQPLGARYPDGNLWQRDFQNGSVIVDPKKHSAEIQVP